jgi:hypothetical protein
MQSLSDIIVVKQNQSRMRRQGFVAPRQHRMVVQYIASPPDSNEGLVRRRAECAGPQGSIRTELRRAKTLPREFTTPAPPIRLEIRLVGRRQMRVPVGEVVVLIVVLHILGAYAFVP